MFQCYSLRSSPTPHCFKNIFQYLAHSNKKLKFRHHNYFLEKLGYLPCSRISHILGLSDHIFFFFFYCSGFRHTLKWNNHGFTRVPHPDPLSHLPLHPIPLGLPSAPGPSACLMHLITSLCYYLICSHVSWISCKLIIGFKGSIRFRLPIHRGLPIVSHHKKRISASLTLCDAENDHWVHPCQPHLSTVEFPINLLSNYVGVYW